MACAYVRRRAHKVKFIKIFKTSSSRYENVANAWAKRLSQRCHKIYIKQAEMLFFYPRKVVVFFFQMIKRAQFYLLVNLRNCCHLSGNDSKNQQGLKKQELKTCSLDYKLLE